MNISITLKKFLESERAGGIILIACTLISLLLVNSSFQQRYLDLWHFPIAGSSFTHWINDGLMAIFFLLIGLELEREIYAGELSNFKKAMLPVSAALGGILFPAGLFLLFNYNTTTRAGAGIPMATDIAFALGVLSLLGNRVPLSVKIFLTALAVIDDLGAIIVIAIFYTNTIAWLNLCIALGCFGVLLVFNRLKIHKLAPYLIGGIIMWYFMLKSGVHASISGVLLAFAIPFGKGDDKSASLILQHVLHRPVAYIILPLFALANTCVIIDSNWLNSFTQPNSMGILAGLIIGKPLGIVIFSLLSVFTGLCALPDGLKWKHVTGIGILGGIGFTMSIFISHLAYTDAGLINSSKLMILVASFVAGTLGFLWLKFALRSE